VGPFLHQFLDVLKVAFHLRFEVLLHIANVYFVHHIAGNPIDDNWHSAVSSVLTLAWTSAASAVALPHFEVK
jgi:hypothetical protein